MTTRYSRVLGLWNATKTVIYAGTGRPLDYGNSNEMQHAALKMFYELPTLGRKYDCEMQTGGRNK